MADISGTAARLPQAEAGPVRRFLQATEIDTRLVGMIVALAVVWVGFHLITAWRATGNPFAWGAGTFMTPRNLSAIAGQTASIAVMACGMVLVIVTRNIDLSVGSILGFVGMLMAVTQAELLPPLIGFDNPFTWLIAIGVGVLAGTIIGGFHGYIIAFLGVPAFIVTLGGLLVWRGSAWLVTSGRTVAPMDSNFRLMGVGPEAAIGGTATWIAGGLACLLIVALIVSGRRQRRRFRFPVRPLWAEATVAAIGCAAVLGFVLLCNSNPWPPAMARRYAEANGIPWPETPAGAVQQAFLFIPQGVPISVFIALATAAVMTFVVTRTRFGRYVFAIGGNPEAAELAGVNTRWVTMKVFMVMGALVGIASAIATARLNSGLNSTGGLDELYTIAAAVIGGTSLSGGVGTVAGAVLGAVVMQSLRSGMVMMQLQSPLQDIVVGAVLVFAVWIDAVYRRRAK